MRKTVKSREQKVEEYQYHNNMQMTHGWRAQDTLSQCHVCDILVRVRETRENVTCEGVLFTLPVGWSRLLSAVNDLTTQIFEKKNRQNFTLSFLMNEHPKQVS